jgi:hypothetical protein
MIATPPNQERMVQMMAKARPVDFEVVGGEEPVIRVKVVDEGREVVLRLKVVIGSVNRLGNDQNTGLPIYSINTQATVGLLKCDPALRARSVFKGPEEEGKGFA